MASNPCSECPVMRDICDDVPDAEDACSCCGNYGSTVERDPCHECRNVSDTACNTCWVMQEAAESAYFGSLGL